MFLEDHLSTEFGCPILLNYLDNIENIGSYKWVAPYQAHLATLDEQVQTLDTLQWANVATITEIEIARRRAEMIARQEEFRLQEEIWSVKFSSL